MAEQTGAMARRAALYEVVNGESGTVLSWHRTRNAAIDSWRLNFSGQPVQVFRLQVPSSKVLVVEGIWHEAKRP